MDIKRCKTLEAFNFATRREEIDSETVRRRSNRDKDVHGGAIVSRLLELPLPLIYDIFLRLHALTIFSCKCVCKTFLKILTDPQFAQDHLTGAAPASDEEALVIQSVFNSKDILLVYNYSGDHANSPCQTLSMPTSAPPIPLSAILLGSCKGLLYIRYIGFDLSHVYYYVCNPVLGEFLALPPHDEDKFHFSAFGFCPKTKLYKVINFYSSSLCKLHTLGTDCWREISGNTPYPYTGSFDQSFKGFLHWIADRFTVSKMICSLNLETELFSFLPPPSHFTHDTLPKLSCFQTGLLGGSFCLSYHRDTTIEVCVMKNYGLKESWFRAFSFDLGFNSAFREHLILHKFINGEFFLNSAPSSVVCCNLQKGTITNFLADDALSVHIKQFHPSFISLKDITVASGGNVEVVGRKMRRNNWSNKGFQFIR